MPNRLIIVDDDTTRSKIISSKIVRSFGISSSAISTCECIKDAKREMKATKYCVLLLDMALPNYIDSEVLPDGGEKVLNAISESRVNAPDLIVGYTALNDDLKKRSAAFKNIGFHLIAATPGDYSWLGRNKQAILYQMNKGSSYNYETGNFSIVSVHGIRTFGGWQNRLENTIKNEFYLDRVHHIKFRYPYVDLFRFVIPKLRKKLVCRLYEDLLLHWNEDRNRKIHLFAHSFGTYILINALRMAFENNQLIGSVETVVLSGSVLSEDYDFDKIIVTPGKVKSVYNFCAVDDSALLASKAFIPYMGMAGIKGIYCQSVQNKFYKGGHSLFFDSKNYFFTTHWMNALTGREVHDESNCSLSKVREIFVYVSCFIGKIKKVVFENNY